MCNSVGATFETTTMLCAVDAETGEILVGGGNDKKLPFIREDPTNAPKRIKSPITDKMHTVTHKRCRILVEVYDN